MFNVTGRVFRSGIWLRNSVLLALCVGCLPGQQGGPSIQILSPAPVHGAIFTSQPSISLSGTAKGVTGITSVKWLSVGRFGDIASISPGQDSSLFVTWTTGQIGLHAGANYIKVDAIDLSNQHAEAVVTVYYMPATASAEPVGIRSSFYRGVPVTYEVLNGLAIFQGDIVLGTTEELESARVQVATGSPRSGTTQPESKVKPHPEGSTIAFSSEYWPKIGGVAQIPYTISARDQNVPAVVSTINSAISSFNSTFSGVIQWVPQSTQTAYVIFDFDPANQSGTCESAVGMAQTQPQTVGGAINCALGTVLHEMGHTIGAWHEQSRMDRNSYVDVVTTNIDKPLLSNFNQVTVDEVDMGLYDYASIMHYYPQAFSKEGLSTTLESVPVAGIPLSNTSGYTTGDIDSFMRLYGHVPSAVTIDSVPSGAQIIVDGTTYTTPHAFSWALNSTHTLNAAAGTQTIDGEVYMFGRWNIPGATGASQNITISPGSGTTYAPAAAPAITVYAADFVLLHPYGSSAFPSGDGTVTPTPAPGLSFNGTNYYYDRQAVSFQANPVSGFSFYTWYNTSLYNLDENPYNYPALTDMPNLTGAFTSDPVTTLTGTAPLLNPPPFGLFPNFAVTVDGGYLQTPVNFATDISGDSTWTAGSTHSIDAVPSPQSPVTTNISYAWASWSDSGGQSHSILQGANGTHHTFTTAYTPTWRAIVDPSPYCGGTISPVLSGSNASDQQIVNGTNQPYTANPATGFEFESWGGDLNGKSNPLSFTIDDELLGTAFFNVTGAGAPITVTNLNPASVAAGNGSTAITVTGTGFSTNANTFYAYWDLNYRVSVVNSSTSATVTLNAGDLDTPGFHRLTVENFANGCAAYVDSTFAVTTNPSGPKLSISSSHMGSFTQAQQNATYTLQVLNASGAGSTSGTVTVTETVPSGLTLVSMAGTNWNCSSNTCTRGDALMPGAAYQAITVTVNVAANAASPQVNQVAVSGGESATVLATDSTVVVPNLPSVNIDSPTANQTLSGTVPIFGWALENISLVGPYAVASVSVFVDGTQVGTATYGGSRPDVCNAYANRLGCPNVGWNYNLNASALTTGSHTLKIVATDTEGTSWFNQVNFTAGVPPSVDIDSPTANQTLSGTVPIFGWALENISVAGPNAVSSVSVFVDGTQVGTATYGSARPDVCNAYPGRMGCPNVGWNYNLNVSALSSGSHTLKVVATDSAGISGFNQVNFTAGVPPSVDIDSPTANQALSGTVPIFGWALESISVAGPNAVSSVSVFVDGTQVGTATYGGSRPDVCNAYPSRRGCPNVGWNYNLNVSALSSGSHTLKVVATDSAGISGFNQVNFTAGVPPSVEIDAPAPNATLSGTVAIGGWSIETTGAVGPYAVSSVTVFVDGSQVGTATYGISRPDVCNVYPSRLGCPNVGWGYNLNVSALSSGSHTLMIVATDTAGDKGSNQVTFQK